MQNIYMSDRIDRTAFKCLVAIVLLLVSVDVFAVIDENDILESTIQDYRMGMTFIQLRLTNLLRATFWLLAIAEFTWILCKLAVGSSDIQKAMVDILMRIMTIGLFWFLFTQGTRTIQLIMNSFIQLAGSATSAGSIPSSVAGINPDDVIDVGFEILNLIWDKISITSPIDAAGFIAGGLIAFLALVVVAAFLAIAILEFYVVGYAAFVLLAFGGSSWTSGYAVGYLKYAMSIGMKVFVMLIITGVSIQIINTYLANIDFDRLSQVWPLLAYSVFFALLALMAPNAIVGVMQGVSTATGAPAAQVASGLKSGTAAAAGGAASMAMGAAGGVMAAGAAAKAGAASPGNSALGAAAAMGKAAAGVASDAVQGRSGSGSLFPGSGTIGGKMAHKMGEQASKSSGSSDKK